MEGKRIKIYNGRTLIQLSVQALLQTDVSFKDWKQSGKESKGKHVGLWTQQKRRMNINKLKLLALELALETFFETQEIKTLHIQMDNIKTLTYFLKMGGRRKFTNDLSFKTNLKTAIKEL